MYVPVFLHYPQELASVVHSILWITGGETSCSDIATAARSETSNTNCRGWS